ncbi:MAG: DHA2 family efflux MFS transporter permease subunit [Alphaproteobacteria bacterium]|nr:DHA2 family efflux MFS transporter permease subunit [Alphaproteobacteria bacterium]
MLATIMQALDTTIANVAVPYMQASLNASLDQVNWVLTSYIVAAAIMTPPTGWLARRFGRKELFIVAVAGFTVASILCGAAQSLEQMVAFRLLQGMFGAPLVPLAQQVLLDIYPRERHGEAMAIWGIGVMVGPILGPTLGGWLTENYHWRWVFYINLPIGIVTLAGLVAFLDRPARDFRLRMDWFGFAMLSLGIGVFQLMLDRGEHLDWFASTEIVVEAIVAGLAFYLFLAHVATAERPFIDLQIFRDRNFAAGLMLICITAFTLFGSLALLTPFMQQLLGYPVLTAGFILGPRGAGTMLAMFLVGRLIGRVDVRFLIALGFTLLALTLNDMAHFTLDVSFDRFLLSGFIQGMGFGFCFVPISTISFSTLAPEHRPQGTSLFSLMRNVGGSVGISITIFLLTRGTQSVRSELVQHITPFAPGVQARTLPEAWSIETMRGLASLQAEVVRQASAVAYFADFQLLAFWALLGIPIVVCVVRPPRHSRRA